MKLALTGLEGLVPNNVIATPAEHRGARAVRLVLAPGARTPDEPNFALVDGLDFRNGSIEAWMAGQTLPDAPPEVRGFVGLAFRIAPSCERFECVYLRPANGRAEVQLRRNRAIQYFSYPDFKFDRLRREAAGEYESYVDLVPGEWTKLRIDVRGDKARVFVHDTAQPTLVVNDLKHGAAAHGAIGLYIDRGTEAYFRDLSVTTD